MSWQWVIFSSFLCVPTFWLATGYGVWEEQPKVLDGFSQCSFSSIVSVVVKFLRSRGGLSTLLPFALCAAVSWFACCSVLGLSWKQIDAFDSLVPALPLGRLYAPLLHTWKFLSISVLPHHDNDTLLVSMELEGVDLGLRQERARADLCKNLGPSRFPASSLGIMCFASTLPSEAMYLCLGQVAKEFSVSPLLLLVTRCMAGGGWWAGEFPPSFPHKRRIVFVSIPWLIAVYLCMGPWSGRVFCPFSSNLKLLAPKKERSRKEGGFFSVHPQKTSLPLIFLVSISGGQNKRACSECGLNLYLRIWVMLACAQSWRICYNFSFFF